MAKLTLEQKKALVDQVLAIPTARRFAEQTQFRFSSDGTREYTEGEVNFVRSFVDRLKQNRNIVNEERENIKVVDILAERTNKFKTPVNFQLKGELTSEMINFLGEASFDDPSAPDNFAEGIEVLIGVAILFKYDVDFTKYQIDTSVVGQGLDGREWVVGFTFRPIPKNIAQASNA